MNEVEAYLLAHEADGIKILQAFCAIPSVSTDPDFAAGIANASKFVEAQLIAAGFPSVEIIATGGHPCVLAEWCDTPDAPTVLIYGHYDVQPPDPLEKWHSMPFQPEIRDGKIFARGVSDDKGPLLIPILVAAAYKAVGGGLPLNVKILIEGEEETGSPHLSSTVARLKERLACDLVISADGAMWRADLPSVTIASRGLVAMEVTVHGAAKDLHSGRHGGTAPNPIRALARMVASLHDEKGEVIVPGFADAATQPDPAIAAAITAVNFDPAKYFDDLGATRPEPLPSGSVLLTQQWLLPTLEFNGIRGGYAGKGTKTVIPAEASVKITCRLVAGQIPADVILAISRHLKSVLPTGYHMEISARDPGTAAFSLDPDLPALAIAEDILTELLGAKPLRVAMGATIPIGEVFAKHLQVATIFFSFSTSDEDYHAPNEYFRLSSFRTGQAAWARLFSRLGQM